MPAATIGIADATVLRYAQAIEASKRIRWEIDRDVIRGRRLDFRHKFMPDSLSRLPQLAFLGPAEARFLSQVQARTHANVLGLVERCIAARALEAGPGHAPGNPVAAEALARVADEALKHRELFARLDRMSAAGMPVGYRFVSPADAIEAAARTRSAWAVLGLLLNVELLAQACYRASIEVDPELSEVWRDAFHFHWKEESQHAVVGELEWRREHERLDEAARDRGVEDLIALVGAVDAILREQAGADAGYFLAQAGRPLPGSQSSDLRELMLKAYRWQYIANGASEPRFAEVLKSLATAAQTKRLCSALASILAHAAS